MTQLGHAPHSALLYTRYGVYMHEAKAAMHQISHQRLKKTRAKSASGKV